MERESEVIGAEPVPMFDLDFVTDLMAQGHSYAEAVQIAATELEGANTLSNGDIHATQTYCNKLNYSESIEESTGQLEGRRATTQAVKEFLYSLGFNNLQEYYASLES